MRIEYRQAAPACLEVSQKDTGEELKGVGCIVHGVLFGTLPSSCHESDMICTYIYCIYIYMHIFTVPTKL